MASGAGSSDYSMVLRNAEENINTKAHKMGLLRGEYYHNMHKLRESYHPKVHPFIVAIHINKKLQQNLEAQVSWLEQKAVKMLQLKDNFIEIRDLVGAREALLDSLTADFQDAYFALEAVKPDELAVLRGYENPPPVVQDTIEAVMKLRGEEDLSWEAARIILSDTYYYGFFITKCKNQKKHDLTDEQFELLEKFLMHPDHDPAAVAQASTPCGAIAKWLHVLCTYAFLKRITAPNQSMSLSRLEDEVLELRRQLQQRKDEVREAEEKMSHLEAERQIAENQMKERYDEAMTPLQDMFFEAHDEFNVAYGSPERKRQEDPEDF